MNNHLTIDLLLLESYLKQYIQENHEREIFERASSFLGRFSKAVYQTLGSDPQQADQAWDFIIECEELMETLVPGEGTSLVQEWIKQIHVEIEEQFQEQAQKKK